MGFNLGNFSGQLSLDEENQAQANAMGTPAYSDQQVSDAAAEQQGASGWDTTQKYMQAANTLSQDDEKQQNGLSKVLGLVGMFI